MAYDEQLAARLRTILEASESAPDIVERKMFGGLAFLLAGNMCVGVHGAELIVRLDPREREALLARPHTRPFEVGGRGMPGWILVAQDGLKTKRQLQTWVARGEAFAASLPPK